MVVRIKIWRLEFFYRPGDWTWNWLDFVIVGAGMVDLWLLPAMALVQHELFGMSGDLETGTIPIVFEEVCLTHVILAPGACGLWL